MEHVIKFCLLFMMLWEMMELLQYILFIIVLCGIVSGVYKWAEELLDEQSKVISNSKAIIDKYIKFVGERREMSVEKREYEIKILQIVVSGIIADMEAALDKADIEKPGNVAHDNLRNLKRISQRLDYMQQHPAS